MMKGLVTAILMGMRASVTLAQPVNASLVLLVVPEISDAEVEPRYGGAF